MKVGVITANIGNYDVPQGIPRQVFDGEIDFFYYHDGNLPFPLTNLTNRYKARYLKSQMHRFLPDYDAYVWLDGRVKIEGNNFVQHFIEELHKHDLVIYKHEQRNNAYEELIFIENEIIKGSPYLVERYANQSLAREILFYKQRGLPEDYPLYLGGMYARLNNDKVNNAFDDWWQRLTEFSNSDQSMLSLICWEHKLAVNGLTIDPARTHKTFTVTQHAKAIKARIPNPEPGEDADNG